MRDLEGVLGELGGEHDVVRDVTEYRLEVEVIQANEPPISELLRRGQPGTLSKVPQIGRLPVADHVEPRSLNAAMARSAILIW